MGRTAEWLVKAGLDGACNPGCSCSNLLGRFARVSAKIEATPAPAVVNPRGFSACAWVLVPVLALVFITLTTAFRIERVHHVSSLAGWSVSDTKDGPSGAFPRMIVPGNRNDSYEWMDQARQMFALGELRVRHVDYENAPSGHDVRSGSPYRWCLGGLAWICHLFSDRSAAACLGEAALIVDPLLYVLLLAGAVIFAARRFGTLPAAAVSAALATLYPFAVSFLPGAPSDQGLSLALGLWSVLPLLAGIDAGVRQARAFFIAGIAGGLGLWVSVSSEVPVVIGIGIGAMICAWIARRESKGGSAGEPSVLPWRKWALGGAVASLGAYLLEYFPSDLGSWELRAVHPVYGIAWMGWGEALALAATGIQGGTFAWKRRDAVAAILAAAALAALPVAMLLAHNSGFLSVDLSMLRLTRLPGGAAAKNLVDWLVQDDFSALVCATLLPLLLIGPAAWLLARRQGGLGARMRIAIAVGPVLVALGFACRQLSWWSGFDAAALALVAAVSAALQGKGVSRSTRAAWLALVALVLIPGAIQDIPRAAPGGKNALEELEVIGLIDRDLARWLSIHAPPGGAVVLAPPATTTALYYYGGLKGLGTLDWENREGIQASVRIVSATTPEEALGLITRHGIAYIVIPSWDSQLDSFARIGLGQLQGSFIDGLRHWSLPPWLRPVPYPLPVIGGFEGQSVLVFEVTEDQDDATSMSRMTEFFVESGNLDLAASGEQALRRFPSDLGALVARAQVEVARGETDAFSRTAESLVPRLSGDAEHTLPWDRKIGLAVVLAQSQHLDQARAEIRRCLDEVDDAKLRSLPTGSLYHLQVLMGAFGMKIDNPSLQRLALDLLPTDLRNRLNR
jgi:hypothetical protein